MGDAVDTGEGVRLAQRGVSRAQVVRDIERLRGSGSMASLCKRLNSGESTVYGILSRTSPRPISSVVLDAMYGPEGHTLMNTAAAPAPAPIAPPKPEATPLPQAVTPPDQPAAALPATATPPAASPPAPIASSHAPGDWRAQALAAIDDEAAQLAEQLGTLEARMRSLDTARSTIVALAA